MKGPLPAINAGQSCRLIRILVADGHPIIRAALVETFAAQEDMEAVAEAGDGAQAVRLARLLTPDVIIMGVRMPHLDGLAATRRIAADRLPCPVLIASNGDYQRYDRWAREAGASGAVNKDAPSVGLLGATRAASTGVSLLADGSAAHL